ncbi:MAG: phosphoribosylformylglycinamidine synthase subunit PurQ, partial [Pseudomonadota bacterium]
IVSGFAPVADVRRVITPQLRTDLGDTELLLIDLGCGQDRLGGSALAQVFEQTGNRSPDVDDPALLKSFFASIQTLNKKGLINAYHDRSDGGLFITLCEMAFAGGTGLNVELPDTSDVLSSLFSEELGAVIQVCSDVRTDVMDVFDANGLANCVSTVARSNSNGEVVIRQGDTTLFTRTTNLLRQAWWETSYHMQRLRDNPACADEEFTLIAEAGDPGISPVLTFDLDPATPGKGATKPRVAILREQGVNSHIEMAAAFDRAGFTCVDVHMSDIISGRRSLSEFDGMVACGGFSYGDVLGAGGGWAGTILYHERARDEFAAFFARSDTFGLGVCNGCQMMARLRDLIPGAEHWPLFIRNRSEQYEARVATVEVLESNSLFFTGMAGSRLPIAVAHGEGLAQFGSVQSASGAQVALRFVDNHGLATERYPLNPNGSPGGVTGLCSTDGRFTIMMPHPERVFRTVINSWHPDDWPEDGPWMQMFYNARRYLN